jgi:hypothetical protein
MAQFRIAQLDLHAVGTDSDTPPGHVAATAIDPLGNIRTFLWAGDQPDDDHYIGSIIHSSWDATAYGPNGGYVRGHGSISEMLAALVDSYARRTSQS